MKFLLGKRGLVVGIANRHSIAAGCAGAFCDAGAQLAITYMNEKAKAYVQPVADEIKADLMLSLDVEDGAQVDAVFERIETNWGQLGFILHSIAYCPKEDFHGRVTDCSRDGLAGLM